MKKRLAKFKKINNNNGLFIPHNPGQRIRAGCNYRIWAYLDTCIVGAFWIQDGLQLELFESLFWLKSNN